MSNCRYFNEIPKRIEIYKQNKMNYISYKDNQVYGLSFSEKPLKIENIYSFSSQETSNITAITQSITFETDEIDIDSYIYNKCIVIVTYNNVRFSFGIGGGLDISYILDTSTDLMTIKFNSDEISEISNNVFMPIITIEPPYLVFDSAGGSKGITVNSNCPFTISENTTWLSINGTQGSTGINNYNVTVQPIEYYHIPARAAYITFTPETQNSEIDYLVMQTKMDSSYLYVTPSSFNLPYSTTIIYSFTITSNDAWTITQPSWVHITESLSGVGNATLHFTVDDNEYIDRTGEIVVQGTEITRVITVSQLGEVGSIIEYTSTDEELITLTRTEFDGANIVFHTYTDIGRIALDKNITAIGHDGTSSGYASGVFQNCTTLETVKLPNSIKLIGVSTFADCTNLTTVVLPNAIEKIGFNAFNNCSSLSSISQLPDTLSFIEVGAFENVGLSSLEIPNNTVLGLSGKIISGSNFPYYNNIQYNTLTGNNKYVISNNFQRNVTAEDFLPNVKWIGGESFKSVTFSSIELPSSVKQIQNDAFSNGALTNIILNDGVEKIGNAFHNTHIPSIHIPDSVEYIDIHAFDTCPDLPTENNLRYSSLNPIDNICCVGIVNTVQNSYILNSNTKFLLNVFGGQSTVTSITLPQGLKFIGYSTFVGTGITSIEIPTSVSYIGERAFQDCQSLQSIVLPNQIEDIFEYTFSGCYSLATATLPSSLKTLGTDAFRGCVSLGNVFLPDTIEYLGESVFQSTAITSISIPILITKIPSSLCSNCDGLQNVNIQQQITTIGGGAFDYCDNLRTVSIGSAVTDIGSGAFGHNYMNITITSYAIIPPNIASDAFSGRNYSLYVPAESVEAYKNHSTWSKFTDFGNKIYPLP